MWIIGVLLLMLAGAAVMLVIGWSPRAAPSPPPWDVAELGGVYTGIIGILAGFSVTAAIFIAGLGPGQEPEVFAAAVGMPLISFLVLIGSAMMYNDLSALAESANDPAELFHAMPHIFANASFYLGLALGWLALRPLLMLIGLNALAEAFTWLLLATVIAGSVRLSAIIYRLTAARGVACVAIPILGVALPVLYRLGAVRVWPTLWPADNAALWLAFVAFAVVSLGFLHQTALIVVHGSARIAQRLRQNGHVIALVYLETVTLAIILIWFAVALE